MKRTKLGGSRLRVSAIGLGTANWGVDVEQDVAEQQLRHYLAAGGNLVDTADIYGLGTAESIVGAVLAKLGARDEVLVATKAGGPPPRPNTTAAHLRTALDESLRKLRVDYVDLWQVHAWDSRTPLAETLAALDWAVSSGRARATGVCNYSGAQTATAVEASAASGCTALASAQVEYSLLNRGVEQDVLPLSAAHGLGVLTWGSLGRGILTGKYLHGVPADRAAANFFQKYVGRYLNDQSNGIARTVVEASADLGCTPTALACAWVLTRPAVSTALVGARSAEQLAESLTAGTIVLPEDVRALLNTVSEGADITDPLADISG